MLGPRALLDESIANAARFILRRVGRKIPRIAPSSAIVSSYSEKRGANGELIESIWRPATAVRAEGGTAWDVGIPIGPWDGKRSA